VSIVNGQVNTSVTYRYMLLPKKAGTYPISNIAVVHKNKRYPAESVEVTVLDKGVAASPQLEENARDTQGNSRDYFLEMRTDKSNPYVNEQVTLTLKFYIAVKYYSSPELSTPPVTTGFWTEVLGTKPPYTQKLNGRNYQVLEIKYALFPTQTGELTIGRAMVRTTVASKQRRRSQFSMFDDVFGRGEEVTARSRPVTINVRPLPTEGRPASFTGTIGRFDISATADKRTVDVNQPVSVSVKITGTGNIKSVAEPTIGDLPDFRVYRASSNENMTKSDDKVGGTKTFEEVFIPNRPGEVTIPSLSFTYFDPSRSRYITKTTRPITLKVNAGEGYAAGADVPYSSPGVSIGSQASDIRYIKEDIGALARPGDIILTNPLYLGLNGAPVVLLLGLVIVRLRREKLSADVGYARSRAASKIARKRLAKAESLATVDKYNEFYGELSLAVTSYIADRLNISPHGLTSDRIEELLKGRGAGDEVTGETITFLHKCDFARFAPASLTAEDITQSLENARSLMVKIQGVKLA
jgi:hypothetical protein